MPDSLELEQIPVDKIDVNPHQPRHEIDPESLEELRASIAQHGVLQPIVVTRAGDRYQLVAGERRLRATRLAGRHTIPALIKTATEREKAEWALIENLQRKDLSCLEEAEGYERLLREFGLTQEELAARVGKSQSAIANKLRILRLPEEVKELISREIITERHARALLSLPDAEAQRGVAEQVVKGGLNVRQTESLILGFLKNGGLKGRPQRNQHVLKILKDMRLFRNGIKQLVQDMQRTGLQVVLEEDQREDGYQAVIRVSWKTILEEKQEGQK